MSDTQAHTRPEDVAANDNDSGSREGIHSLDGVVRVEPGGGVGLVLVDEDGDVVPIRKLGQCVEEGGVFLVHFTLIKLGELQGGPSDSVGATREEWN